MSEAAEGGVVGRDELQSLADELFGAGVWSGDGRARSLSSLEVMRFLVRIERKWSVAIPDSELRPENFESLDALLLTIARHCGGKA